jgi:hypothetical protein
MSARGEVLRTTIGQVPIRREVISKAVVVEAAAEDRVEQPIDASVEVGVLPPGLCVARRRRTCH